MEKDASKRESQAFKSYKRLKKYEREYRNLPQTSFPSKLVLFTAVLDDYNIEL